MEPLFTCYSSVAQEFLQAMILILLLLQDWELYPVWGGGAGNVPNSAAAAGLGAVPCLGWRCRQCP
jgi:hypothetical protein